MALRRFQIAAGLAGVEAQVGDAQAKLEELKASRAEAAANELREARRLLLIVAQAAAEALTAAGVETAGIRKEGGEVNSGWWVRHEYAGSLFLYADGTLAQFLLEHDRVRNSHYLSDEMLYGKDPAKDAPAWKRRLEIGQSHFGPYDISDELRAAAQLVSEQAVIDDLAGFLVRHAVFEQALPQIEARLIASAEQTDAPLA